jgi:hypothetical protein
MAAAAAQAGDAWTEKHKKRYDKIDRQKQRQHQDAELNEIKRKQAQGQAVPIPGYLQERNKQRVTYDRDRVALEAKGDRQSTLPPPVAWDKHVTMVCVPSLCERNRITSRLRQLGGRVTNSVAAASAFIAPNPANASIGAVWRAALRGCPIASAEFEDNTRPVIHHRPAVQVAPLNLWVSRRFKDRTCMWVLMLLERASLVDIRAPHFPQPRGHA